MKRDMYEFLLLLLVILSYPCLFDSHSLQPINSSSNITFSNFLPHQCSLLLQLKNEFMLIKRHIYDFDSDDIKRHEYVYDIKRNIYGDSDDFLKSYPKMKSWKAGSDCCSRWDGVSCDMATGDVIGLHLSQSWLFGPLLSNSSLFRLLHLRKLNLAFNDFTSCPIPSEFGQLSRLTHLNLSNSEFSGHIPISQISRLRDLISLDLSFNVNYGPLYLRRAELGMLTQNMTNLRQLHLDGADLFSAVPIHLANLSSLTHLSFESCNLHGEFPNNIFNLPNIQFISLSRNHELSGSLPEFSSGSMLKSLDLSFTNFSGKLPNSIGNLKFLNILMLGHCRFSGIVPSSIWNLTQLRLLYLGDNGFIGQIPSSVGNLTQLEDLRISSNLFSGKLTESLPHRIKYIDLSENQLTGTIPSTVANLTFLSILVLSNNSFTGAIPGSLFKMPSLIFLSLENNQFTGYLSIQNVSNISSQLEVLSLSRNKLTGQIPSSLSKFILLKSVDLASNDLSGRVDFGIFLKLSSLLSLDLSNNRGLFITNLSMKSILPNKFKEVHLSSCNIREFPEFLKTQYELQTLDLSNNSISDPIPKWLLSIGTETLNELNLCHNFISGWEEAPSILPWKAMEFLDLHSNMFHGSLVVPPKATLYFSISENRLAGRIDPLFCKLGDLQYLDLSSNKLSGTIPQCLGGSALWVLNLRRNNLSGNMPRICGNIRNQLQTLDLSYNSLRGKIPKSLIKCKELKILNLGHNQMTDTYPFMVQSLSKLKVLILSFNKFYGPIWHPQSFSGFVSLSIIDLSFNNFAGSLPSDYFRNWTSMQASYNKSQPEYIGNGFGEAYSVTLVNKGLEMPYVKILTFLVSIDFSNNKFHGEIPKSLGDIRDLVVLNLSSNCFIGPIPPSLGNLIELESLDLSKNKLSGEIPQQLTSLTFLEYLDFSENELVGPIPQARQIGTFLNSSFEGNWGLCGPPLSKSCGTPLPPPHRSEKSDDSILFDFGWEVVAIGYGCGFIIGLVIEYIVTWRCPYLVFKIFRVIPPRRRR